MYIYINRLNCFFLLQILFVFYDDAEFNELIDELNKMPLTSHTLKVKQRKIEIDRELDKLEQSVRIFSRAKVYVKLNEDELIAAQ